MSEGAAMGNGVALHPFESDMSSSGGALLRRAREAEGLSLTGLATLLKVSVGKLEALESDRYDLLPDIVFARALASSVCRTLKVDAAPVLERFPSSAAPHMKTDESGINAPFRTAGETGRLALLSQLRRPLVLAVLFLLLAALGLLFTSSGQLTALIGVLQRGPASDASGGFAAPTPSVEIDVTPAATSPIAMSAVETDAALADVLRPQVGADGATGGPAGRIASPLPLVVEGNGAVTGLVVLKARGDAWVEVVDAMGIVQVRKTMAQGETLGASGTPPLSVTVGRADSVDALVRGKSIDLLRVSKNNVARFEVK